MEVVNSQLQTQTGEGGKKEQSEGEIEYIAGPLVLYKNYLFLYLYKNLYKFINI